MALRNSLIEPRFGIHFEWILQLASK